MLSNTTLYTTMPFKHKIKSLLFFILTMNALFLIYLLCDKDKIFSLITTAKIEHVLSRIEPIQAINNPNLTKDAQVASGFASNSNLPKEKITALNNVNLQQSVKPLSMLTAFPISSTGACYSLDSLKSEVQIQSAKALISSGPLREKAWAVTTPTPAMFISGVETSNFNDARKLSETINAHGIEPISISAKFVAVSRSDNEANAEAVAKEALATLPNLIVKTKLLTNASEKKTFVVLAQTRGEIQTLMALPSRLPGSKISAISCPQIAENYLLGFNRK